MKTSFFYSGFLTVLMFSLLSITNVEAKTLSFTTVTSGTKSVTPKQLRKINEILSGRVSDVTLKRSLEKAAKENDVVGQELFELAERVELDTKGEMSQESVERSVNFLVNVRKVQPAVPLTSNPKEANVARDVMNHISEMFSWPKENFTNAMNFLKGFNAAKKAGLEKKDGGWVAAAVAEGFRLMNERVTGQGRYETVKYREFKKDVRELCRI